MRRTTLPVVIVLAALLGLIAAAPAAAATTGTICGRVTAFTAPTAVADGSITIDGTVEVIDSSAFGVIDASTLTVLAAVADADATTCLEIVANEGGEIVDLDVAAQAEICGTVTLDTTTGVYSIAGVALPTAIVAADADLAALLDAAVAAGATLCADVSIASGTGLIATVSVNGTLTLCGDVSLDADSVTIAGVDVPLSLLDAEAVAVLEIAVAANADVCLDLVIDDTHIVQANLSADITLCGEVSLDAAGNAVVDGVVIDASLLDAGAAALIELAATADGTACATVVAVSSGGNTSVSVDVTVEVCAEVTAIGDGTITLGGVTLAFAGAAGAGIEVGDVVCLTAGTGPTGPVVDGVDSVDGEPVGNGGSLTGGDGGMLPDTAVERRDPPGIGGVLVALAVALVASTMLLGHRRAVR